MSQESQTATSARPSNAECRLCGGVAWKSFDHLVLGKFRVDYFRCAACGSLFTEQPYWLADAYAFPGVHIDVGMAYRTLKNWLAVTWVLRDIGIDPGATVCLDYGGGLGLFTRLMRDAGYDFYTYDQYRRSYFADYFERQKLATLKPVVITCFEVFEHFPTPREQLGAILALGADLILFTTDYCNPQTTSDWSYLVPECGQHIFFYSRPGLASFVDRFGYDVADGFFLSVLLRRGSPIGARALALQHILRATAFPTANIVSLLESVVYGNANINRDAEIARATFLSALSAPVP
jgi:hypothetical protein